MVRGAPDAQGKLRLSPRKDWYANVEHIETPDPYTVIFRLKRPQPSLLMMLASGYSPVYAAHVNPADYRNTCVGTGPFKLKEWRKGEFIDYVKNPDYFVKGRPYLDGLRYVIIVERARGRQRFSPASSTWPCPARRPRLRRAVEEGGAAARGDARRRQRDRQHHHERRKPPFDNVNVRQAVSYAIDRGALIRVVLQGGAVPAVAMMPRPYGVWGLVDKDLPGCPATASPPT
jgi:peptide/nickel transport system substrate-binding protein